MDIILVQKNIWRKMKTNFFVEENRHWKKRYILVLEKNKLTLFF